MTGHVALITGGTRGLGRAIAVALARGGHTPALLYRSDEDSARAALEEVQTYAPSAVSYRADIADPGAVDEAIRYVTNEAGPIGILVNNAFRSGRPAKKTHELEIDAWREDIDVNLTGHFIVTQRCLPSMIAQSFGRVFFIGSLAQRGEPGRVAYATVKAALTGLAKTIAGEYAKNGITANVISPGFIDAGAFRRLPEDVQERAVKSIPSKRAGRAEEVAELIVHLAGPNGGFVTGQVIGVDGGAR